jgi:hypothetical protein
VPDQAQGNFYLEHINALAGDVAEQLVLIIKMSAEHLCGLVDCMFDLDCYASTSLGFLDNL